jgi:hypothetical protein
LPTVTTSSPGPTSNASIARDSAADPLAVATHRSTPHQAATADWTPSSGRARRRRPACRECGTRCAARAADRAPARHAPRRSARPPQPRCAQRPSPRRTHGSRRRVGRITLSSARRAAVILWPSAIVVPPSSGLQQQPDGLMMRPMAVLIDGPSDLLHHFYRLDLSKCWQWLGRSEW